MYIFKEKTIAFQLVFCLVFISSSCNGQFLNNNPYGMATGNQETVNHSLSQAVGDDNLLNVLEDSNKDVAGRAEQALETFLVDPKYDVSDVCLNHTKYFLAALVSRQQWALRSKLDFILTQMKLVFANAG